MKDRIFKKMIVMILSVVLVASMFPVCVMAAGNTYLEATPLSFDQKVYGSITDSNKYDYYKFTLPSSGIVTIKVQAEIEAVDYDLYYGEDATDSVFSGHAVGDDISKISNKTYTRYLTAGVYYFCVSYYPTYSGGVYKGDYNFTVNFESSNESFVEYYDGSNNSMKTANSVSLNKKYTGFLAYNDSIDYYKFVVPSDTEINISAKAYLSYVHYYLYDDDGEKLDYKNVHWDNVSEMSNIKLIYSLSKGTYYFIVEKNGSNGTYEFIINANTPTPTPTKKPTPTPTKKPTQTGWVNSGSVWYYYNSKGTKVTGWQQIGGSWFFFNSKGVMQTGWVQSGGKWYYMGSGKMVTGWVQVDGKWYFMSASGAMATGWVYDGGKWYYMSASGAMATGWVQSGGKWYYMSPSGVMVASGWVKSGNTWYYFDASGAMVTGTVKVDGKMHKFSSSGAWLGYA